VQRIVVVEDDLALAAQMVRALSSAGYAVEHTPTAPLPSTLTDKDLVVLDLTLPNGSGLDLLRALRTRADVPVIVVSGNLELRSKVRAFGLGADDYLTKPFWPEELLARVEARLRRPGLERDGVLEVGPLRVELEQCRVFVAGVEVHLTPTEMKILTALLRRPASAVTREVLVEAALTEERADDARSALDVHVSRLRKKLGGGYVETVWGVGYRLVVAA
jgi:DNA-binding response OmpR family regulator